MLGNRPISRIGRAVLGRQHYIALCNMAWTYPSFPSMLRRYLLGSGTYPVRVRVRTPLGVARPVLYSHHDLLTLNEVFCRRDYPADERTRVVVDLGSNIGLSALFFLTRHARCTTHLYEPVPLNIERLHANLSAFQDRYTLHECAVAAQRGRVRFGIEETGRYGGIDVETGRAIDVECRDINSVLDSVLSACDRIDILKIDTEGAELTTATAIESRLLARIDRIYLEAAPRQPLFPDTFRQRQYGAVCRLIRAGSGA